MLPLVTSIEGCSLHDGPGIRSVIFFKGCPLNCIWCHNPENKKPSKELYYERINCIGCESCVKACPKRAISLENQNFIDRDYCNLCFQCVEECPSKALSVKGEKIEVIEIIDKIIRYKPFFDTSGGGITLSGGEPTLNMVFISKLLKELQDRGIHTLIETCGVFEFKSFKSLVLPFINAIYFDIKIINSMEHNEFCGGDNKIILKNFEKLCKITKSLNIELTPRTPLIPGITDKAANIESIIYFYKKNSIKKAVLLPNNPAWMHKLDGLGKVERVIKEEEPIHKLYDKNKKLKIKELFNNNGIEIKFG
ncbi:pyruvate formate lyase activating enzyme [Candidatus Magnetomoraceae bacterium gMMP-15]